MSNDKQELKPCPCGKTPDYLGVNDGETYRWKRAFGDCCSEWEIEFRVDRGDSANEIYQLAVEAWNEKPRKAEQEITFRDIVSALESCMQREQGVFIAIRLDEAVNRVRKLFPSPPKQQENG